jgi:hypothetical protein
METTQLPFEHQMGPINQLDCSVSLEWDLFPDAAA